MAFILLYRNKIYAIRLMACIVVCCLFCVSVVRVRISTVGVRLRTTENYWWRMLFAFDNICRIKFGYQSDAIKYGNEDNTGHYG